MMFRHSTCVVCGVVPPSRGLEERPPEEQGPPDPPSAAEIQRLLSMRNHREPHCPRCQHRIGLHLGRIMAAAERLGTDSDTIIARSLKVPVVLLKNVRRALCIADPRPRDRRTPGGGLSAEQLAVYRDGTLGPAEAAQRASTTIKAVRVWRERHLNEITCPQPPDPIP